MANLQILSLVIKNYRQYRGEVKIDLETEGQRHINIIEGENGTGKSNLLNAITLCLFGEEQHQENNVEENAVLPYINIQDLEDTEDGQAVGGYIEIEMGIDEPEFIFTRRFRTFRVDGSFNDVLDDLEVKRKVGTDWKSEDNPVTTRNEILPERVSRYFMFDGEQLQEFFGESYQSRVQSGILDVSHIELLDRALDHLDNVHRDIRSDAGNYEGRPKEIRSEIDELEEERAEMENEQERIKEEIHDTEQEIEVINAKLQDVADEKVKRLYEKREMLEGQLDEYNMRLSKETDEAEDILLEGGPLVFSQSALVFAEQELDNLSEKGQLPPKIKKTFIDELIERGECICGADLNENPQKVEQLMALQREVSTLGDENFAGKTEIPRLLSSRKKKAGDLQNGRQEISRLERKIDEINSELREITQKLKSFDIPDEVDVGALESQREELKEQRDSLIRKQTRVEGEIEELEQEIGSKETELKEELKKEERYQELSKKLEFVDNVTEDIESVRDSILHTIRNQTQENINEYFNDLIWKEQDYVVILEDDYRIRVLDEHGENQLGSLSAGETQVLALSFMAALSQISGFQAPIIIDTPLGRISGEPKRKIARNLPAYLEDTQVTFLMTDQEYTSDVRGLMENQVEHEYILDFHDGKTEVKPRATV